MRGNGVCNRESVVSSRKRIAALVLMMIAALVTQARSQTFPDHPVRLIIPFPPGGSIDTLGRIREKNHGGKTLDTESTVRAKLRLALNEKAAQRFAGFGCQSSRSAALNMLPNCNTPQKDTPSPQRRPVPLSPPQSGTTEPAIKMARASTT
jgi:hypothetical protein